MLVFLYKRSPGQKLQSELPHERPLVNSIAMRQQQLAAACRCPATAHGPALVP